MALNPSIILAGQQPDIIGSVARGQTAGAQMGDIRQQNALRDMLKTNGAGIMAGDGNALNALAQFDPQAALGVQNTRLGMDQTRLNMQATDQRMQMLSREEQRQIEAQAAQMTAAQRAAEAAQIEQGVAQALQAQTPEQWDAFVQTVDPSLVGQFENRDMIAARYMSVADSLKRMDARNAPVDPTDGAPSGYRWNVPGDPTKGVSRLEGMQDSSPLVTVDMGSNPSAFDEQIDKASAGMFTSLYENLPTAMAKSGQVENLAAALEAAPTGAGAAFKSWLGNFGVQTEGLSEIQAVEAAINRLVPQQRVPGSGPMSDADLALFQRSLPRLINTPEGNRQIVETMRGLAEYEASQARIAAQVVSRQMTRQEGQDALMNLPNPLAQFRGGGIATPQGGQGGNPSPAMIPSVGEVVDGYRFKGGDPANQASWEPV